MICESTLLPASEVANAAAPESPIWFDERLSSVMDVLATSAEASSVAAASSMLC